MLTGDLGDCAGPFEGGLCPVLLAATYVDGTPGAKKLPDWRSAPPPMPLAHPVALRMLPVGAPAAMLLRLLAAAVRTSGTYVEHFAGRECLEGWELAPLRAPAAV